jgi:hypothetical protein
MVGEEVGKQTEQKKDVLMVCVSRSALQVAVRGHSVSRSCCRSRSADTVSGFSGSSEGVRRGPRCRSRSARGSVAVRAAVRGPR